MIHPWGVPRAEVGLTYEQPLPWNAPEVHVSFHNGLTVTCRVTRHAGDLLRVELGGLAVPIGTRAELQWTQQHRGCYAAGTVTTAPPPPAPGVYVRVDESVSGIERRLGARIPAQTPVTMSSPSGLILTGRTADLSLGGARIVAGLPGDNRRLRDTLHRAGAAEGGQIFVDLTLPSGAAHLRSLITDIDREPGQVRVRFLHVDSHTIDRLAAFLYAEQRRIADGTP
jgi:hypothetical protein